MTDHFSTFATHIRKKLDVMCEASYLYTVKIDSDKLWETYLNAFPEGTNPIYRERTEHDCSTCRRFIKNFGNIVEITPDYKINTMWDIETIEPYQTVCKVLHNMISNIPLQNVFAVRPVHMVTTFENKELVNDTIITWHHLAYKFPRKFQIWRDSDQRKFNQLNTNIQKFQTFVNTYKSSALSLIIELIAENQLYRGKTYEYRVKTSLAYLQNFHMVPAKQQSAYCFHTGIAETIHNTAIGALAKELSEGTELHIALAKYDAMVAPQNYRRTTAPITQSMIRKAKEKLIDLDLEDTIYRRHATLADIPLAHCLFINHEKDITVDGFDALMQETKDKKPNDKQAAAIPIETFIKTIIPKATKIELYVEPTHKPNFVNITTAQTHTQNSDKLFVWKNPFAWTYNGNTTDSSIAERVKSAGGNIIAPFRCSLAWHSLDDYDLHLQVDQSNNPKSIHIYHGNRYQANLHLDVDMNVHADQASLDAVENIYCRQIDQLPVGEYRFYVHNYTWRNTHKTHGFTVEFTYSDKVYYFTYPKHIRRHATVTVCSFRINKQHQLVDLKSPAHIYTTPYTLTTSIYNLTCPKYHTVSAITLSPNHWTENIGLKHYMFFLNNCQTDKNIRGFYNEYLNPVLREHRKVFEILGDKVIIEPTQTQLAGLGFSESKQNSIYCRVTNLVGKQQHYKLMFKGV